MRKQAIERAKSQRALLSVEASARADRLAVRAGISVQELMGRAGKGLAEVVQECWCDGPVVVICGPGNNGGDGYIAAQELRDAGRQVRVYAFSPPTTAEARWAAVRFREAGGAVSGLDSVDVGSVFDRGAVLVDALFGAGLSRSLAGAAAELVKFVAAHEVPVVSADMPSGLNGDTGRVSGEAFRAAITVAFERARPGHFLGEGARLCGEVRVIPIGIPPVVLEEVSSKPAIYRNHPTCWPFELAKSDPLKHKYDYGHTVVVGGPPGAGGAARLAAGAALRAGAGLVTIALEPGAVPENAARLDAVMVRSVAQAAEFEAMLGDDRIRSILIGPGAGTGTRTREFVEAALRSLNYRFGQRVVVLDADALSVFNRDPETLFSMLPSGRAVLTPHEGEFRRLFFGSSDSLDRKKESTLEIAVEAARRAGAVVLLKGACSVIANPQGECCLNTATGPEAVPWLATAGAGDVLAGLVAGFAGRCLEPMSAAAAAAYVHMVAARQFGAGLTSDDLGRLLPGAIEEACFAQDNCAHIRFRN